MIKVSLVVLYLLNPTLPPYEGNLEKVYYDYPSLEECQKNKDAVHKYWLEKYDNVISFCLVEEFKQ